MSESPRYLVAVAATSFFALTLWEFLVLMRPEVRRLFTADVAGQLAVADAPRAARG